MHKAVNSNRPPLADSTRRREAAGEWSPHGSNIFEADEFGMGSGQFLLQPWHVCRVVGLLLSPH